MKKIDIGATTDWIAEHTAVAITGAAIIAVIIMAVVGMQVWAALKGRTLTARASIFFAVVQAGVAYVTITGVYEFWAHVVEVPTWDAVGIAVIIEAVTWAAVADIFVWGSDDAHTGLGRSGPLFWTAVLGGGVMAVVGSESVPIAIGRSVVAILGAMMWYVRIRQKTRPRAGQGRWANPFKTFALRRGWMIADDGDNTQTSREWQIRTLTRAINKVSRTGRLYAVGRYFGERTIRQVMEAGDAAMVRDARQRYALQEVLRTEVAPTSASMKAAIDAARADLNPAPAPALPPAPPLPTEAAPPVAEPSAAPARRPAPKTPPRRVAAATAARQDPAAAAALRERAVTEALVALHEGRTPTAAEWGARFGKGDEWGRQQIVAARKLFEADKAPTLNGSVPG